MNDGVHISEAARRLGVSAGHLRVLERDRRIPAPKRDLRGRVYSEAEIALLRSMGVGSRPAKLKRGEEVRCGSGVPRARL